MFILANLGYCLFARTKNKATIPGLISSIAATVVMIFLAEYLCLSFEIFLAFEDAGVTFWEAFLATPEFLSDPSIGEAVGLELVMAYFFSILATVGSIINVIRTRRRQRKK